MNLNAYIYGGLGNQLFQFNFVLFIAKKYSIKSVNLIIETKKFQTKRELQLFKVLDLKKIKKDFKINFVQKPKFLYYVTKKIKVDLLSYFFFNDNYTKVDRFLKKNSTLFINGYFQKFFLKNRDSVYVLKPYFRINNYEVKNNLCIHIRGGDFVELGWTNSEEDKDFIIESLKKMKEIKNEKLDVFSDDHKYAKKVMDNTNFDYQIISSSITEDFFKISLYKYKILTASTFSFWANEISIKNIKTIKKEWPKAMSHN